MTIPADGGGSAPSGPAPAYDDAKIEVVAEQLVSAAGTLAGIADQLTSLLTSFSEVSGVTQGAPVFGIELHSAWTETVRPFLTSAGQAAQAARDLSDRIFEAADGYENADAAVYRHFNPRPIQGAF